MASGRDALPALMGEQASDANKQRRVKSFGANRVSFAEDLKSPRSTTSTCEIDSERELREDDASMSSCSDSGIDDVVSAQMTIRAPEAAKPARFRPSVGMQFRGQQDEARSSAQHRLNSPVDSAAKEGSNTAERGTSTKRADATVSVSRAEEDGNVRSRLRARKLDPLMFRSSPACPTQDTSSTEVDDICDQVGSRSANRANTISVGSGGRRLCGGHFSSAPTRPTSMKPAIGNRFASSRNTDALASSSRQAHSSPPSEVVLLQKADSSGSGVAYNLVQFKASPSLSTTQDAGRRAQSVSAPRKTRDEARDAKKPEVFDEHKAEQVLKQSFSGWSKKEVKAALQGKYSAEDIAEVLEALGLKSPKLSGKKL